MCGIIGVLKESAPITSPEMKTALERLRHRGPDSQTHWISASREVALGHTRLSVIDLATGQQPHVSPDGRVRAVVNGEFYGYESVRTNLREKGYPFQTRTDSEILIPLYLAHGAACVEQLRGEFAFILWDESRQALLLARDRFGIKPLAYGRHAGAFWAASEIKALLALGMPAQWNPATVHAAEGFARDAQNTFFQGIRNVPPGHAMWVTRHTTRSRQYWDFDFGTGHPAPPPHRDDPPVRHFRKLLKTAVRMRLRSDVPVACYLSGGIDSAVVLAMTNRARETPLPAFTIAFDDATYDESAYATEMARRVGAPLTLIKVTSQELAAGLADTVWHNECPLPNTNAVAKYILSRHVRRAGFRVVLTGEGADEILGGYHFFREDLQATTPPQEKGLAHIRSRLGYVPFQLQMQHALARQMQPLRTLAFQQQWRDNLAYDPLLSALDQTPLRSPDRLVPSLYIHAKSVLPNYILTSLGDRAEMAHGIEGRLPYLDHPLVEYLTTLPRQFKIRGGVEKYILRQAARGLVTATLVSRPKHPFLAPPACAPTQHPLRELMRDTFYGEDLKAQPFYEPPKVIALFEKVSRLPEAHQPLYDALFMHLLSLCLMAKRFGMGV